VRETQQRTAIRQALLDAGRPLSHEEVLAAAQRDCPGLGIATVYRNVRRLREQGWLREVELPGAPSRYEVADKDHHHHFHCVACDRIYEVEDCPGDLKKLAPSGFLVQSHEIILYGLCRNCRMSRRSGS
jgi:Fur family ferric uptake transcriptional regulator